MSNSRKASYRQSGRQLLQHLDGLLHPDIGYPEVPSWGYAFTYLASLSDSENPNKPLQEKALHHLVQQDKSSPNYSWEFVVYAIQSVKKIDVQLIPLFLDVYQEKGTRMFNWFLLRNVNKKLCKRFSAADHIKLRFAALIYQKSTGLILDEFKTRSFQYHAFCLFVLAELIEINPDNVWLRKWFYKGIEFSMRHILDDGQALYIGRGQEQIFGYGSLIYAMEYCCKNIRPLDEEKIKRVSDRLLSFQRDDGSYPLVLRTREPEPPNARYVDEIPAGWYGYNTLFDYQPFLAYCLLKTSTLQ